MASRKREAKNNIKNNIKDKIEYKIDLPTRIMASNRRFFRLVRTGGDTLRRSAAALILQGHAGDFAGETFADQPRDLRGRLVMAKPGAVDVGNAIALGIGAA